MNEFQDARSAAIPCPNCDYDLRGQSAARCPECGTQFESMDAMIRASVVARTLLSRVHRWRTPLNMLTIVVIGAVLFCAFTNSFGRLPLALAISIYLSWPLCNLLVLILLIQVLRWRRSPWISRSQRRELNRSVRWLLFLLSPTLLVIVAVILARLG